MVEVFDRHGVEYLIVGGHATRAYGAKRPTKDSDALVRAEKDNLARVAAALRELHAYLRVSGLSDEEARALPVHIETLLRQFEFTNWRTDAGDLDVMKSMVGPTGLRHYEDLAGDSLLVDYAGVTIRVASLDAIVASKEAANRPKDREALPELHALQEELRRQGRASRPSPRPPWPSSLRRDPGAPSGPSISQ